jgi:hypothetical protein
MIQESKESNMRRVLACAVALAVVVTALSAGWAAEKCAKSPNLGKVRHVVIFKFKDGTPKAQIEQIEKGFRALPSKVPGVVDFEWGTNMSPEKLDQGFTHCFLVTFVDIKARDTYLPHPAHQAFVKTLKPYLEKAFVVDYVAKD